MHYRIRGVLLLWLALLATACQAQPTGQQGTTYMVPMRDGVKLSTLVCLPVGKGPWPVVLTRTPYGKQIGSGEVAMYNTRGYARVVQDMRGRFASEGKDSPFFTDAWGELQDGYDTIDWISKQPWCNGKVGMIGGSATGITQYLAAGALPPALKSCYASVATGSLYHHGIFPGGVFRQADIETWLKSNAFGPQALQQVLANPSYNALWRSVDLVARAPEVKVPMVHIGGWYDIFSQGTLDAFQALQHRGGAGAKGKQVLVIGPWVHGGKPAGELSFPANARQNPAAGLTEAWFGRWLRDGAAPGPGQLPVHYYVMGACGEPGAPGNAWRNAADWPVPAQATPLYLHASHAASFAPPREEQASLSYRYDPAHPVPTLGGGNLTLKSGPLDQRPAEGRDDVLLFTTEPLAKPLEVTGQIFAKLHIASDCPDTDFTAKLTDVYPDGRSMLVCDGILRLRYREGFEREKLMEPGKVYEATVDLWSTSIIFNQGHRIRVAISSSNAPRFEPNPNTGAAFRANDKKRIARNTLYLDRSRPSLLLLPVPR